jgi:uncharacterized protein YuzE
MEVEENEMEEDVLVKTDSEDDVDGVEVLPMTFVNPLSISGNLA